MDINEKLNVLLKRKEKADNLPPKEKLKWKAEIINIEQEIKSLKIEIEKQKLTEQECIILDIFSLNKAAIQYLYENFITKNNIVIEEFISEILSGIYDYFQTQDIDHLRKSKQITNILLDTIYQNHNEKKNDNIEQLELNKTNEPTPWG